MKKIYLPLLGLASLLPCQIYARDSMDCREAPKCTDYGYIHNGCPGNFVSCPFDTNFKTCDEEAYQNDFKFALASGNVDGRAEVWDKANSTKHSPNYSGAFIVGANPISASTLCTSALNTRSSYRVGKHSHTIDTSGSFNFLDLFTSNREKASTSTFKSYSSSYSSETYDTLTASTTLGSYDGKEVRPANYAVDGYFYNYTPKEWEEDQLALSQTLQDCAFFGYTDEKADCPGDYVVCPFDNAKVMCDMQAQAGEIKFSLQTADHDGWLLCDGDNISTMDDGKYADSELSRILSSTGFENKLPNYKGVFLRMKGIDPSNSNVASATSYATRQSDDIVSHSHTVTYTYDKFSSSTQKTHWEGNSTTDGLYNQPSSTTLKLYNTGSWLYNTNKTTGVTRPPNYAANIFIYTGKL